MKKVYPTVEKLHELFVLDSDAGMIANRDIYEKTGVFKSLGSISEMGVRVNIKKDLFMRRKIVWAMHFGDWPPSSIYHNNGIKTDDRISNLTLSFSARDVQKIQFIQKSKERFPGKLDYSKVEYLGSMNKIELICKYHGSFTTTPHSHLSLGSNGGCLECKSESLRNHLSLSKQEFLEICQNRLGTTSINMDDYIKSTIGSIKYECEKHGELTFSPPGLIFCTQSGCRYCDNINPFPTPKEKYENYTSLAREMYDGFYTYPDFNISGFQNKKSKIEIVCPEHGGFRSSLLYHLAGSGCRKCNPIVGRYTVQFFKDNPEYCDYPALLYYISINNGEYYKIGITRRINNIDKRIVEMRKNAKLNNFKIGSSEIIMVSQSTLLECFNAEQVILKEYRELRIYDLGWTTEIFSRDISSEISHFFD